MTEPFAQQVLAPIVLRGELPAADVGDADGAASDPLKTPPPPTTTPAAAAPAATPVPPPQ
jgi:hypothetical protein